MEAPCAAPVNHPSEGMTEEIVFSRSELLACGMVQVDSEEVEMMRIRFLWYQPYLVTFALVALGLPRGSMVIKSAGCRRAGSFRAPEDWSESISITKKASSAGAARIGLVPSSDLAEDTQRHASAWASC